MAAAISAVALTILICQVYFQEILPPAICLFARTPFGIPSARLCPHIPLHGSGLCQFPACDPHSAEHKGIVIKEKSKNYNCKLKRPSEIFEWVLFCRGLKEKKEARVSLNYVLSVLGLQYGLE